MRLAFQVVQLSLYRKILICFSIFKLLLDVLMFTHYVARHLIYFPLLALVSMLWQTELSTHIVGQVQLLSTTLLEPFKMDSVFQSLLPGVSGRAWQDREGPDRRSASCHLSALVIRWLISIAIVAVTGRSRCFSRLGGIIGFTHVYLHPSNAVNAKKFVSRPIAQLSNAITWMIISKWTQVSQICFYCGGPDMGPI